MNRLLGKTAIITGGTSGIGRAIAETFEAEGAKVVIFDIKGDGDNIYHVDVTKEKEIEIAMKKVYDTFGAIDILVNNAGCAGVNKPTDLLTEKEWDNTFDVDVKSVFFCTKHVISYMRKNGGGSIINMSSVYGTHGSRGDLSAYHASKGAVTAMTRQDAITYGLEGIRVNAIHPGGIKTPLMDAFGEKFPGGREAFEAYVSMHHPVGRMGEPKDIAYGALYLASDEAAFVTGISLYIDGGYTAR